LAEFSNSFGKKNRQQLVCTLDDLNTWTLA
jgi:hypothetical protein